jgi:TetR/AcrR family transcriptional regulator, mexJK operon transcriptional repressor
MAQPNATPPSPRSLAKRQQMLSAARRLFLDQGYARTSTDAVAQAAGVSKQTLYVYFPGKAELLTAIVAAELDGLGIGEMLAAPSTLADLRDALLYLARAVTSRLMTPDGVALFRLLVGEVIHLPELRELTRQAFPLRLLGGVEHLLTAAHQQGLIDAPDPDLSARLFVGPIMSFIALDGLLLERLPEPVSDATLTRLTDLFLKTVS